jgi:hypothetical protein
MKKKPNFASAFPMRSLGFGKPHASMAEQGKTAQEISDRFGVLNQVVLD